MTGYRIGYVLLCLSASLAFDATCGAQETPPSRSKEAEAAPDLQQQLLGAWVLAGRPDAEVDPKPGARMKFFGHNHWTITQSDPDTGKVIFHHGGTYTLVGNKYTEKLTFANESTESMIGSDFAFTIKVEDGKYTQIGDGNPYTEVWKRPAK